MRISDWSSDVCSSDLDRGGFEPAQHFVLDHVVDHQPQAGEPRALNPAVVHRFMRQRIAPRPVDEGWPTLGIVRTERRTVWPEQIADQIERAVGSVLGRAIAQPPGVAEAGEGTATLPPHTERQR